jgi:hypothetical protein
MIKYRQRSRLTQEWKNLDFFSAFLKKKKIVDPDPDHGTNQWRIRKRRHCEGKKPNECQAEGSGWGVGVGGGGVGW